MREWGVRARSIASEYFVLAVAVAVLLALLGGWVTYSTHVDPEMETEQVVQGSWESGGSYDHSATVTENNRVFPTGATLEDRSTYYTNLMPILNGTFRYRFTANRGELDVDATTRLVIQSVAEDGEVHWRVEESLGNDSTTLAAGDALTVSFSVNVTNVMSDIDAIEEDLGSSPGEIEVLVRTHVTMEGSAAGGPVDQDATYELGLEPGSDTYTVTAEDKTDSHRRVEPVTRPVEYGGLRSALGPILLVLGLIGLVSLVVAHHQDFFEVSEREWTTHELAEAREEFDDWISRGTASPAATDRATVDVDSLEDLVDVAVDTNSRVLEDIEADCYYVLTEGFCYRYEPPVGLPP